MPEKQGPSPEEIGVINAASKMYEYVARIGEAEETKYRNEPHPGKGKAEIAREADKKSTEAIREFLSGKSGGAETTNVGEELLIESTPSEPHLITRSKTPSPNMGTRSVGPEQSQSVRVSSASPSESVETVRSRFSLPSELVEKVSSGLASPSEKVASATASQERKTQIPTTEKPKKPEVLKGENVYATATLEDGSKAELLMTEYKDGKEIKYQYDLTGREVGRRVTGSEGLEKTVSTFFSEAGSSVTETHEFYIAENGLTYERITIVGDEAKFYVVPKSGSRRRKAERLRPVIFADTRKGKAMFSLIKEGARRGFPDDEREWSEDQELVLKELDNYTFQT